MSFSPINRAGVTSFVVTSDNLIRTTITSQCEASRSPHQIEMFLRLEGVSRAVVTYQELLRAVEENILIPWSESVVVDFRFFKYSVTLFDLINQPGAEPWYQRTCRSKLAFNPGVPMNFVKNIVGKNPMPDTPERYVGDSTTVGYQVNLLQTNKPKRLLLKGHSFPIGTQNIDTVSFNAVREVLESGLKVQDNTFAFYFPMINYFRPVISVVVEGTRPTATSRKKGLFS